MIKISSITTSQPVIKKQAWGGDARWKLGHLPPGTDKKFTDSVVPLAKLKAGTLAPWAGLNHKQVQKIVDAIFGQGKFVVADGNVWCGLVSFSEIISTSFHLTFLCHVDFGLPEQLAQWVHNCCCWCFQQIHERERRASWLSQNNHRVCWGISCNKGWPSTLSILVVRLGGRWGRKNSEKGALFPSTL